MSICYRTSGQGKVAEHWTGRPTVRKHLGALGWDPRGTLLLGLTFQLLV